VARLHSRGQVNHLLVGLTLPEGQEPQVGAKIWADGAAGEAKSGSPRPIGELTSIARSPKMGWIGLAFVRRAQAEPGTRVRLGDQLAQVARLPFERAGVSGAGLPQSSDPSQSELQPES
jgi:glycine cleavage system aminomethyltransferase T